MNTEKIQILQKANCELDKHKEEMNRPEEDVVTFSICYSVRKSIADFLSYYLAINNVDASGANTVADMLQLCSRLDDKFRDLIYQNWTVSTMILAVARLIVRKLNG